MASSSSPVVVVIAGEANMGRSTALNNIFGTDFLIPENSASRGTFVDVREVQRSGRSSYWWTHLDLEPKDNWILLQKKR